MTRKTFTVKPNQSVNHEKLIALLIKRFPIIRARLAKEDGQMSDEKRMTVEIIGRVIGDASGWDECGDHTVVFYGFVPYKSLTDLPAGDLYVDFEHGHLYTTDDVGNEINKKDMIEALSLIPRRDS